MASRIQFPDKGLELSPLHWEHEVLATGPPEKSLEGTFVWILYGCKAIYTAVATGLEKVSFHSNPKERQCQRMSTIALISHYSKVMLKILQARFQLYVNCEPPGVQADFRKGRGTRDQIANICWII